MKTYFNILLLFCIPFIGVAQEISTSKDILKMLMDSKVKYEMHAPPTEPFVDTLKYEALNEQGYYQMLNGEKIQVNKFIKTDDIKAEYDSAESYYRNYDYDKAREHYQKILDKKPEYIPIMTYIGETYQFTNQSDLAETWYKKAINKNFIDYMAHWFLACVYLEQGKKEDALDEILIAQVLNRNNPRILNDLKKIVDANGYQYDNWYFKPEIMITKTDSSIQFSCYNYVWLGYGLCRLAWLYEPGYRESKLGKDASTSSFEELECLSMIIIDQKGKDTASTDPQICTLVKAFDAKHINEFIFYERWLPVNPMIVYTQPKDQIIKIAEYVKECRLTKQE